MAVTRSIAKPATVALTTQSTRASPRPGTLIDTVELAANAVLANVLLNLDETITKE